MLYFNSLPVLEIKESIHFGLTDFQNKYTFSVFILFFVYNDYSTSPTTSIYIFLSIYLQLSGCRVCINSSHGTFTSYSLTSHYYHHMYPIPK